MRLNMANARLFVAEQPQYKEFIAFSKDGFAYCADQAIVAALVKFEKENHLNSSLAASAVPAQGANPDEEKEIARQARLAELDKEIEMRRAQLTGTPTDDPRGQQDRLDQLMIERQKLSTTH